MSKAASAGKVLTKPTPQKMAPMFKDTLHGETQYELPASQGASALLGDGADLAGRLVEYWGEVWTVQGKNYLGD